MLTTRYWHIQQDSKGFPSGNAGLVVVGEADWQISRLNALVRTLEERAKLADRGGHLTILDTNVYLHCQPFEQVRWDVEMARSPVRLVLPMVVLEELDKVKYMKGDRSDRAGKTLKILDGYLSAFERDGFATVRDNVTIEILRDDEGRQRRENLDDELIDRALLIQQAARSPVTVATNDRSMRVRAHARQLNAWPVPDHLVVRPGGTRPAGRASDTAPNQLAPLMGGSTVTG